MSIGIGIGIGIGTWLVEGTGCPFVKLTEMHVHLHSELVNDQ